MRFCGTMFPGNCCPVSGSIIGWICAVRHSRLREVAPAFRVGRQVRPQHGRRTDVIDELLRQEEKGFLLARAAVEESRNHDRTADAVARDIDFEERLLCTLLFAEVVVRVPFVAPSVIPGRSLQLVRARLGDNADEAARLAAVLGGVAVGDDGDFANRIEVRRDVRRAIAAFFADRHAVNRRVLVERRAAVDARGRGPTATPRSRG